MDARIEQKTQSVIGPMIFPLSTTRNLEALKIPCFSAKATENSLPHLTNKKTVRKILDIIRKGSEGVSRSLFSVQREKIIG